MTGQYQPGQGFVSSPRMALAQALMAQGASREPVRSSVEGIARLLTAGIGGWVGSGVKKDQQDALADALKALEDPSVPEAGRAKAAYSAYATKSPDTPNPFEQIMLSGMLPKERFVEVKNDKGQTIGQRSTLTGKLEPFKLDSISAGQKMLNAFGEVVADGGAKIPEGMIQNPDGSVSTVPNFAQSLSEIERAKATGRGQGEAATVGAIETAKNAPLAARAGMTETATRQAQNRTPTAPAGFAMGDGVMSPITGGPADPAYVQSNARAQATGSGSIANQAISNAGKLRDDFSTNPAVKSYREVVPIMTSMNQAAKDDSKAGDLNLVYGLAKIFDPNSVVREGEMVMVNNTASLPDWLVGSINGLNGGARLQPDTRAAVMRQAQSRFDAYSGAYDQVAKQFTDLAGRQGVDPKDVIVDLQKPTMDSTTPPETPRITNDAAGRATWEKLKPGQAYVGPDGVLYVKPGGTR